MRAVLQRVTSASVTVDDEEIARIGRGLVLLVGAAHGDTDRDAEALVEKVAGLRVFPDDEGRMNRSLVDVGGAVLVVSQFTLLAETRRGRRPSFTGAAMPDEAEPLIERIAAGLVSRGIEVATGRFAALMAVSLVNHGPVTIVLEVRNGKVQ